MKLETVGIVSPGDMGHIVGRVLRTNNLRVITCLQDRSTRTKSLAEQAQIEDVETYAALVREADVVLSILVPANAPHAAQAVAQALSDTHSDLLYADCNAIAPQTAQQIGKLLENAGGRFIDASIIGPPPRKDGDTRFYASGPHLSEFQQLNQFGLTVVPLGNQIGQASAIKMCYASLTKGLTALSTELLTAAEILGVSDALKAEFQLSQADHYARMEKGLPGIPTKSRRWVGEMEEISRTFEHVGLTPKMLAGAADMYRFVGQTELADRTPEDPTPLPSLTEMISILARSLDNQ